MRNGAASPAPAADPGTHPPDHFGFSDPREVLASVSVPGDQKRRILLDWLQDEFALLVADDEGMVGARSPRPDQVHSALRDLDQAAEIWRLSPWPAR